MSHHVVVGAGATAIATARLLAASGERVKLVSRRGRGPQEPLIETVAADAADAERLCELAQGASTLFNCAMPRYDRWPEEFPPLAAALLIAAERSGAGYVMLGNCYGYAPSRQPVDENTPLAPTTVKGKVRTQIWQDALAAHQAGRLRATEVRASDFVGHDVYSIYNLMVTPLMLAGKPAQYPADLDAPHSWTYIGDAARTLVAAANNAQSWGRAWHVPPVADISARQLTARLADLAGVRDPQLIRMTAAELERVGREDSIMAEVSEIMYLHEQPFLMESALTRATLGVAPATLDTALKEMAGVV